MRLLTLRRMVLMLLLCSAATAAFGATPAEFYRGLLLRGISSFEAERFPEAATYLKLAAFGFVDSIENYQTAQVYLTLTYDRAGEAEKARDAARRVIAAERIQPKFGTLPLPAGVTSSFTALVSRLLGSSDALLLKRPAAAAPAPPASAPARPQQSASLTPAPATPPETPLKAPAEKPAVKPQPAARPATPSAPAPPPANPAPIAPASSAPAKPASAKTMTPQEANAALAAGDRAVASAQLNEARRAYRTLLTASGVSREALIRVAEGLYRARDFEGALEAFARVGTLRRGEEPYHYYMAVASYETGKYARAKAELSAAIPFIEITPDVARYRAKIEATVD